MRSGYLYFYLLLSLLSCSRVGECEFFNYEIRTIDDVRTSAELETRAIDVLSAKTDGCTVCGDMILSYTPENDCLYSVTDLSTGELKGNYCSKGRSWNEPLSAIPLSEVIVNKGNSYANVFSFSDAKLFRWNITASMAKGMDVYDSVIKLESSGNGILPLMSVFQRGENEIIAYNSGQISRNGYNAPAYEVYETESGKLKCRYELFNKVEIKGNQDDVYAPGIFLSNQDCIKPDRTKLAFGMFYMPILSILDLETGICKGVRLSEKKKFSPKTQICHFMDVQCDDDYIYALYFGELSKGPEDYPDFLYIFDWNGEIIRRYKLTQGYTTLQLDGTVLYMLNYLTDNMSYIEIRELIDDCRIR